MLSKHTLGGKMSFHDKVKLELSLQVYFEIYSTCLFVYYFVCVMCVHVSCVRHAPTLQHAPTYYSTCQTVRRKPCLLSLTSTLFESRSLCVVCPHTLQAIWLQVSREPLVSVSHPVVLALELRAVCHCT